MNLNMPDWVEWGNFFFTAQAGQRQAYLDARKPENRKLVYKLVEESDVFVENLRPGVADGEGYSPGALAERKPGVIYVSVKLNTHEGPWTNWPGYDFSAGGIAGLYTAEGTSGPAPAATAGERRLRHHDRIPRRDRGQGRSAASRQGRWKLRGSR